MPKRLTKSFFSRSVHEVAPDLIGATLLFIVMRHNNLSAAALFIFLPLPQGHGSLRPMSSTSLLNVGTDPE